DGVRRGLGAQCVERLGGGDSQPAPLPCREPPVALVATELVARLVNDSAGRLGEALPAEERAIVVAREEAGFLAVGTPGDREPGGRRLRARFVLRLRTEREPHALEQPRIEPGEHVALVLRRVGRTGEQPQTVAL